MRIGESTVIFALVLSCASPTLIDQATLSEPSTYGWNGIGYYRIINYATGYTAGLNGTIPGAAIVSRPIDYDRYYDQIWTFAEVGAPNQYMIVELITGAILSGVKSGGSARGADTASLSPGDKKAIWLMDQDTWRDEPGTPVILTNIGVSAVLDLSRGYNDTGIPILTYPAHRTKAKNQAWYLMQFQEANGVFSK